MAAVILQLVTAFTGSLGFAVVFNVKRDKLPAAAFGGLLAWAVYLFCGLFMQSDPIRFLISSVVFTIYAEIMARIKKTPATFFLVPAAIPLIPGGSLYTTMQYMVAGNEAAFQRQGIYTLLLAGSIAAGILCAMTLWRIIAKLSHAEIMLRR